MNQTYVVSDIHGCYDEFIELLDLIKFDESDLLIVNGDLIDRGPKDNFKLVKFVMKMKNIVYLKGNHEEFLIRMLDGELSQRDYYRFGGKNTLYEIQNMKNKDELLFYYNYIKKLPLYYKINVNSIDYTITHAGFSLDLELLSDEYGQFDIAETIKYQYKKDWFTFFCSADIHDIKSANFDSHVIVGHIPTFSYFGDNPRIYKGNLFTDVDCGCTYKNGRLGCLCLNDLKEFYIDDVYCERL